MSLLGKLPKPAPANFTCTRPGTMLEVFCRCDSTCYVLWSRRTNRVLLSRVVYDELGYTGVRPRTQETRKASA
jgi:hypothetical protein